MITIDEAIAYCENTAKHQKFYAKSFMKSDSCQGETDACTRSAERFSAMAGWLRELKAVTDRRDLISRAELFNKLAVIPASPEENGFKAKVYAVIQGMDSVSEEENKDEDRERR